MRSTAAGILLLLFLSAAVRLHADDEPLYRSIPFRQIELPFYTFADYTPQVALRMDYAQAVLYNPEDWKAQAASSQAYEIDLVFTKYPRDLTAWRTNYYELLNERLRALFALDSSLRAPGIRWNLVLQTQCETEEDAKRYFHGFVIKYRPRQVRFLEEVRNFDELKLMLSGQATTRDSTVTRVLDRHPEWGRMLVVMDWTGSMYKFGAQVVIWHKINQLRDPDRIAHLVFFNDGDSKSTWMKETGKTGGIYRARSTGLDEVVATMQLVMRRGNGGDAPENDLEALLTSIQNLDGFDEVVLIADNKSDVRDMALLEHIRRPVRIILCDVRGLPHAHYVQIAKATGGSLHTISKDIQYLREAEAPPPP
ncbi:MAG: hypothetical protein NW241_09470 [Bacteroidia bacterium]|nr:hypothetical protein [Bacteroidia bacterium]